MLLKTREYATTVFNSLDENQLIDFLRFFADDNTLARIESDLISTGVKRKRYSNFKEILEEIENEEESDV